jgi:single-stranded-DNA-specific exonuclease
VVCLGDKTWKPAILGLVANSIMQERGGLVCLWGEDGAGALKGSCRSDGNISVAEVLAACGDTLEAAGGHAASGGFTVSRASIHTFPETLAAAAQRIGTTKTSPATEHKADAILGLHEVGARLYEHLSHLSPFGVGNPKPVFRFARTQVGEVRRFGKEKAHTEVIITSETNGARVRTFQFFQGPDDFTTPPAPGLVCDIMATVERDTYRGGLALRLVDIVLSQ